MALIDRFNSYEDMAKATRLALFEEFYQKNERKLVENGGIKYEELEDFFYETGFTIIKDATGKEQVTKVFFNDPENNEKFEKYLEENRLKFNLTTSLDGGITQLKNGDSLSDEDKEKINNEVEEKYKKVPKIFRKILDTETQIKIDRDKAIEEESKKNGANAFFKKLVDEMMQETMGRVNTVIQDPNNEYITIDEMKGIRKIFVKEAKDVKLDPYYNMKNMTKDEQEKIKEKEMEKARLTSESKFNLKNELNLPNFREVRIPNAEIKKALFEMIQEVKEEYNIKPKEKVVTPNEKEEKKTAEMDTSKVIKEAFEKTKVEMPKFNFDYSTKNDKPEPEAPKPKVKVTKDREIEF